MKMNYWLILGVMVATSVTAQDNTNLPAIPPPANTTASAPVMTPVVETAPTNAPAPAKKKKSKKKKAAAKAAPGKTVFTEATVALVPGPAEVCVSNLNVRGQAGLKGEVVSHLQKGDSVNVLSELTLGKHKADEPSQWARITLPASGGVWVRTSFIDPATKTVAPKKLNLRGGPGENYSVLGMIERGTSITETEVKGDWTKIEVPTNAYAFVAAMYLKQEASGTMPTNPAPSTETPPAPPTPVTVAESQPINTMPETPAPAPPTPDANVVPPPSLNPPVVVTETNIVTIEDTNPPPPPPPRVVTHEGVVRSSVSPVAPTYFELYDPATGLAINYLFSPTTNLDLARYNGLQINVTGEEGLDSRWKDTPVLSVQKIYVLSTNAPASKGAADAKKTKYWHLW
jgi:uncharacterized protein YgiM (DUF1202 family)